VTNRMTVSVSNLWGQRSSFPLDYSCYCNLTHYCDAVLLWATTNKHIVVI